MRNLAAALPADFLYTSGSVATLRRFHVAPGEGRGEPLEHGTTRMRLATAVLATGLALASASAAHSQALTWDLFCHYDHGSIAFTVSYARHRASGDMVSDQLAVSDSRITFDVSAARTTLQQDFHVTIDRSTLKWTTDKAGWGGVCKRS